MTGPTIATTEHRYGMFGLTEDELRSHGVTLLPHEATAILRSLTADQIEYRQEPCWSSSTPRPFLYIQAYGRWWKVNREDLAQQVRTSSDGWALQHVIEAVIYGVRLDEARGHLTVIDALTDG